MFWDKGFTPSQNIEALLEKESSTVEEFLDDDDILQECKTLKKPIVSYFLRPDVIKRLVELIITEPSDELPMAQRFRHANMACEILTLGLPSLDEKLLSDTDTLSTLYSYLQKEPPLNPLLSSFFSKTFSMLFTKKAEQDWFLYQQMCLQLLEYIKSQHNFLDLICKHFETPVIPDLIMQMMKDVEGGQLKRNLYEWLTEDKLVERLIAILGNPQETDKHANVAEFLCDLIQQGRTMRHTEQENDSFEPAFEGSNPILKAIESEATIEALLNVILEPNAQESAIVSGISVVLTLIKPVVFVDEPSSDRMKFIHNREKDIHEQILTTVIRVIAPRLKDFNELLSNPPNKPEVVTTAAKLSPPFGMTRLQICRVFTVLLQTKNEEISKAICETDFFETLLTLFKQYCWNNFLHSEVEKCLQLIFYTQLSNNNNSTQGSTIVNDGSFGKGSHNGENNPSYFDFIFKSGGGGNGDGGGELANPSEEETADTQKVESEKTTAADVNTEEEDNTAVEPKVTPEPAAGQEDISATTVAMEQQVTAEEPNEEQQGTKPKDDFASQEGETNENDTTKVPTDLGPSALQTHVIVNCKLISKLIDCWQFNKQSESTEKGRRLGYMGHLIKIFKHITNCISESEHIGALIESNLSDASESELWQSIINPNDGDFTMALATQNKMLANCNAHEAGDFSQHLPKDFLTDNSMWDYIISPNMLNNLSAFNDSSPNDIVFALEHEMYRNDLLDNDDNAENDLHLFQFGGHNIDDEDDDDEENAAAGDVGHSLFGKSSASTSALQVFGVTNNPWDNMDPFSDLTANSNTSTSKPWAADFGSDNFADFDSHFSSFTNDLGESLSAAARERSGSAKAGAAGRSGDHRLDSNAPFVTVLERVGSKEEYDNNANVEKSSSSSSGDFVNYDDVELYKNEKTVVATIVRSLHTVMQDSEDDLEDDEGMWTKPLGAAAQRSSEDDEDEFEMALGDAKEVTSHMIIANGPSSKQTATQEIHAELHNSTTDKNITATQEAASVNDVAAAATTEAETKTTITNATTNDKDVEATNKLRVLENATGTEQKLAAAATTTNTIEVAPTT